MPNLNDTQLVILSAASQRDGGAVLPLPSSLKRDKPAVTKLLAGLLRRGLVAEQPTGKSTETWRQAKDGRRIGLTITDAGLKAIAVEPVVSPAAQVAPDNTPARRRGGPAKSLAAKPDIRPGTKLALLTDLLRRKGGVTIADAVKATGWQAHSIRGAISGTLKKKLGLAVASEAVEGRDRVYRITR